MIPLMEKAKRAAEEIEQGFDFEAQVGVILGSGYPSLVSEEELIARLPYSELFFFPAREGEAPKGELLLAEISGIKVVIFRKRLHYYEGLGLLTSCYPVFLTKNLGADHLLLTNAAGALSPSLDPGDLMLITDHINLIGDPLLEIPSELRDPPFLDLSSCYHPSLIQLGEEIFSELNLRGKKGVLVAVSGPSYETPAEVRRLRMIGGDAVCMSTVPEAVVACYLGIKVAGLSLVSNRAGHPALSHDDVLRRVRERSGIIRKFIRRFIARCGR